MLQVAAERKLPGREERKERLNKWINKFLSYRERSARVYPIAPAQSQLFARCSTPELSAAASCVRSARAFDFRSLYPSEQSNGKKLFLRDKICPLENISGTEDFLWLAIPHVKQRDFHFASFETKWWRETRSVSGEGPKVPRSHLFEFFRAKPSPRYPRHCRSCGVATRNSKCRKMI